MRPEGLKLLDTKVNSMARSFAASLSDGAKNCPIQGLAKAFASLKVIALFCALTITGVAVEPDKSVSVVADQILVQPKKHLSVQAVRTLYAIHGLQEVDSIPQIDVRVLKVPAASRDRVLAALQNNPNIQFAELNGIAQLNLSTNDPEVVNGRQWHLPKVQAPEAWNVTAGNASTIVAVLDTGVSPNHPDLVGNLLQGYNFHSGNSNWADDHGRGTQVAGVAQRRKATTALALQEWPGIRPFCQSRLVMQVPTPPMRSSQRL